jgi:uncharacterized membrane protein YqiK
MTTTIATICQKHNITPEQFDRATHCTTNGQHFYIVESQSEPGAEYHVKFNRQYGKLTCTCKAGQQAMSCWHMRAAMASEEHYKATETARRQAEQAEIEAQEYYRFEMAMHELESALDALDAIAARAS